MEDVQVTLTHIAALEGVTQALAPKMNWNVLVAGMACDSVHGRNRIHTGTCLVDSSPSCGLFDDPVQSTIGLVSLQYQCTGASHFLDGSSQADGASHLVSAVEKLRYRVEAAVVGSWGSAKRCHVEV